MFVFNNNFSLRQLSQGNENVIPHKEMYTGHIHNNLIHNNQKWEKSSKKGE